MQERTEHITIRPNYTATDKLHLICWYRPFWAKSFTASEDASRITVTYYDNRNGNSLSFGEEL